MLIQLPTKKGQPNNNPELDFNQLVVIGANGSGKTRFGAQIEKTYLQQTHRVSAQKSLSFPPEVSPKSKIRAEAEFLYGYYQAAYSSIQFKSGNRWGDNFNTSLLNDYEKLLVLLHTEEYEEALSYKEGSIDKPVTKLDRIQIIWETVLPHRKLLKKAGVIEAYPSDNRGETYNASQMSDGERVIFYLIGEVICSPQNSIIIIDEPEMHIHKSLVKNLFDLIENERTDCAFIYLTHDIDFAFTRQNAIKIWAKSYENSIWDYEILNETSPIPEQLYLEVLGSRKPVLFIEGADSSIDYEFYEQVYSDYTVKPLGSCEKVIQSVKSFNEQNDFHHIESFGIIDRDRRQDQDIPKLNVRKIWVLDVAEAENLLLLEGIVKAISLHLGRDPESIFTQVKQNLISFFTDQLETQIMLHFKEILRRMLLGVTNFASKDIAAAISEIDGLYSTVNKQKVFDDIKVQFENIVSTADYNNVLRVFNMKNALIPNSGVCNLTGIKSREDYLRLVVTLLKKGDSSSAAIKAEIDSKIIKNAT